MTTAYNPWVVATASAAASTAALMGSANAQPAPGIYNWTGYYIGAHVSGTRHDATTADLNGWGQGGLGPGTPYVTPFFQSSTTAVGGGGQVGYNWQSGRFVFGGEADIGYVGARTTFAIPVDLANCGPTCAASATNELTWLATFRGRAGFEIVNNVLLYGTAGVAIAQVENRWGYGDTTQIGTQGFSDSYFKVNDTRSGFVYGGGVEFAALPNATVRLEVLHADLGTSSSSFTGTPNLGGFGTYVTNFTNKVTTGRAALTWRW